MISRFNHSVMMRSLVVSVCVCFMGVALAITSPKVMLETATNKMISELKANQARIKKDPSVLDGFVYRLILPYVDLDSMVRQVLGKEGLKQANSKQRSLFKAEFKKMVISTYSSAFATFDDHKVKYLPLSGDHRAARYAQVRSIIKHNGGRTIRVNYRLVKRGEAWKVYDFSVDGISMVKSYRSQFSSVLKQKGMDGLIKRIRNHNIKV